MSKNVYVVIAMVMWFACSTIKAQTEASMVQKAGIENIDVMPMPGMPDENGVVTSNSLDIIIKFTNPQLAGKALVNIKPKGRELEVIKNIEVLFFEKDGQVYSKIGKRERPLKRGAVLVNSLIDDFTWEQVTVEVLLFDKAGVQVGSEVE